jgi:flavin-dependent dehydrogenase
MQVRFDICVLGGGLSGSAFAILMAQRGARVALIEKTRFDLFRAGEHLPPDARGALRVLGCEAASFYGSFVDSPGIVSRWISQAAVFKPYIGHAEGLGLNLARRRFEKALFRHAERSGVTAYQDAGVVHTQRDRDGWTLSFADANALLELHAHRVVDATGRISVFARRQGATWDSYGDLIATVARLRSAGEAETGNLCLQVEACEHGWWSLTPTPRDIVATFYASAGAKRTSGLDERAWWHWGLQTAHGVRKRLARSAATVEEMLTFHGEDWFAIGDAAAAHDPLSGHGILYAFETAFRAAEMASADLPLKRLGPLYEEAITGRFARHIEKRAGAYAEAAGRFPSSSFWRKMALPWTAAH